MNRVLLMIVGLMALTFLRAESSGCDSSLVGDPTMDMWCGKTLCTWTIDKGDVQRVATWHRSDYGVGLVGDEVIISQHSAQSLYTTDCLEFRLQADHDDGVNLFIGLDLTGDSGVEYSQPLNSDKFRPSIFYLRPPLRPLSTRFVVRKTGKGAATLAEVKIKKVNSEHCVGVQPFSLSDLEDGSQCNAATQCRGGSCQKVAQEPQWADLALEVCSRCTSGAACSGSQVCGLAWSSATYLIHRACVDQGKRVLGERCQLELECASGVCCDGVCSSCCSSSSQLCAVGSCSAMSYTHKELQYTPRPSLCSPGGGKIAAGGPCMQGSDCTSNSCKGSSALKVCNSDGRTCKEDKDCSFTGVCVEVGQAGGLCQ